MFHQEKYFVTVFKHCTSKIDSSQPEITCLTLTIKILEEGVKYVQS